MKLTGCLFGKRSNRHIHRRGFALIVTLSLMILLTVIAVGLLTLSSVSLRTTSQTDAMYSARANARATREPRQSPVGRGRPCVASVLVAITCLPP